MRGLYAITRDNVVANATLYNEVEQALLGGAAIIQYRDKRSVAAQRVKIARRLLELCRAHDALFIVNDDIALAKMVDADGVHIGRDDTPLSQARAGVGNDKLVGVSCYNSVELACKAADGGADYVAFGCFFASVNKPGAARASLAVLRAARRRITLPIVAIGGITADNGAPLIDAGADMLAAIEAVFGQSDVTAAAMKISALF